VVTPAVLECDDNSKKDGYWDDDFTWQPNKTILFYSYSMETNSVWLCYDIPLALQASMWHTKDRPSLWSVPDNLTNRP